MLVTKDIENAAYRVDRLKELKNISIYAQAERNEAKGIILNAAQLEFAQWQELQKRIVAGLLQTKPF